MKKLIPVILTAMLLLSACGGNAGAGKEGKETNSTKKEVAEVVMWSSDSESSLRTPLEATVEAYNSSQDSVKVKVEYMDDESLKTKMKVAGAGGKMPDVFNYWTGENFNSMVSAGVIADITSYVKEDSKFEQSFVAGNFEAATTEGKIYGIPNGVSSVVFYYNKQIFTDQNLTVPQTWSELLDAAAKLDAAGITPIAMGGKDRWPLLFYFAYLSNRIGGNEPFQKAAAGEGNFADPSFIEAGNQLRKLTEVNGFGKGFLGMSSAQADAAFQNGSAAMILMGDWSLAAYTSSGIDIGYFPFPEVEGGKGDPKLMHGGFGGLYAVSNTANKDAAMDFLKFMMSPEQRKSYVEATGAPSTVKLEVDPAVVGPFISEYLSEISTIASGYFPYFDQAIDAKRSEQVLNAVQSIVGGDKTVESNLQGIK